MSSLTDFQGGSFYRLRCSRSLPPRIARMAPEIVWLPTPPQRLNARDEDCALFGQPIDDPNADWLPLASTSDGAQWKIHFSVAQAIESLLLERYYDGLQPSVEMRLPFNYSALPNWIKVVARCFLSFRTRRQPQVPFPPDEGVYCVEWLAELARLAGQLPYSRSFQGPWPEGRQAALTITHDVDTGWLFRHPDWIERICDLEEQYGFHGAWYCVPTYSSGRIAEKGLRRLLDRGCEVGVHGYSHDAKLPLLKGRELQRRFAVIAQFAAAWKVKGFRSEWLYRTPEFLERLGSIFHYDSSVPSVMSYFTTRTRNGCSSCFPYRTYGQLVELPLTLPMDEWRRPVGASPEVFWAQQVVRVSRIIELGGLALLSIHPQPHQAANTATLRALGSALREISIHTNLWIARPDAIAAWVHTAVRKEQAVCG